MRIEIACKESDNAKVKGDLFESLSRDLLKAQSYEVIQEIRIAGAELDLLCKHKVSGKEIYVECKAHRDKISAPILRQLLGTITAYEYKEGWLVSTSEFGKEAKGFIEEWKKKSIEQASKLSFYSPEIVISSLKSASVICEEPEEKAAEFLGGHEYLGGWSLIVSELGRFWSVYALKGGMPHGVLIFNATNGKLIKDRDTLSNISQLKAEISDYDLFISVKDENNTLNQDNKNELPNIAEVQIGDSWDDYRPARPQDFVGRDETQRDILSFLSNIIKGNSDSRIFAITGNSGLGKSSLIAKLRDRSKNKTYRNKIFIFAVDIRGATSPAYIGSALLKALTQAQANGFGDNINLQLTDPTSPMSSESISTYLQSIRKQNKLICIIFDQFEELYSKPELFGIFNAAKGLMLDVAAVKENLALGFAWKTDSTTQQDHPAYHMWHDLADFRKVYKLSVFNTGEISKSVTKFEKEITRSIPIAVRNQLTHNCQGFPWLLKKLCINLYENIRKYGDDTSIMPDFDVRSLFEDDVNSLSPEELNCLKLIANNAPADWSEVIDISGIGTVNSLVHKRLIIRSGTRLNIYWDIFKDYLTTSKVPIVPFNYIPTSDLSSMLKVSSHLIRSEYIDSKEIASLTGHNERTVWNIGADLVMFGVAERKGVKFKLKLEDDVNKEKALLTTLREKVNKHSFKISIFKKHAGKIVQKSDIVKILKDCLPNSQFSEKTWGIYANRIIKLLVVCGYVVKIGKDFSVQDKGTPIFDKEILNRRRTTRERGIVFSATASPAIVCDALDKIQGGQTSVRELQNLGYRNALNILNRFDLIRIDNETIEVNDKSIQRFGGSMEAVWYFAKIEPAVIKCIEWINLAPENTGYELGELLDTEYKMSWTRGSKVRNGNSLRQWSTWIRDGLQQNLIPEPPGRKK